VRRDDCEVGTQFQIADRDAAAKATGLDPDKVKIHTMMLGGDFGRRAVRESHFERKFSKAVNVPIKVVWTREDDMRAGW
jgi:isoquinoline 1-oxidoreductase beta subunit